MSEEKDSQNYINNFMNQILINPLAEISKLMRQNEHHAALISMRTYLPTLPPNLSGDLGECKSKIERYFTELIDVAVATHGIATPGGIVQVKQNIVRNFAHGTALKLNYVQVHAELLAIEVFNTIFPMIYDKRLFEALKGTPYQLEGQGPSLFSYGKPPNV